MDIKEDSIRQTIKVGHLWFETHLQVLGEGVVNVYTRLLDTNTGLVVKTGQLRSELSFNETENMDDFFNFNED